MKELLEILKKRREIALENAKNIDQDFFRGKAQGLQVAIYEIEEWLVRNHQGLDK